MSAKGVEALKLEICRLLKGAAERGELQGDEPLVVLWALAVRMVAEISSDVERRGMAVAYGENFLNAVEMVHYREKVFPSNDEDLLH